MIYLGYALLVAAVVWFAYKLYVAYSSAGGTDFMMPIYDAALYPPMMVAAGLFFVLRHQQVFWPWWAWLGVWLVCTLVFAGALKLTEEMGDREL